MTDTIIVVGASEGGVEAIRSIAAALPAEVPAAIFVVLHIGAYRSQLTALLNLSGPLPASHARDNRPIGPGHIYVAPARTGPARLSICCSAAPPSSLSH